MKDISLEEAEAIFKEHSTHIYRTALFLTRSEAAADDITQETFLQAFQKFTAYDPARPIAPWLYKIALNITRNHLRKQKWLCLISETPDVPDDNHVEEQILQNELGQELWREINRLSLKSREIIVLHYYSGLKLSEISSVLGIPLGTCKSRLNTALVSLDRRLQKSSLVMSYKGDGIYETT